MSTKSVKKTTVTTKTTQQSSGSGSQSAASTPARGAASPGRARVPSPARLSRTQEKEELSHLNDRLANYIDRVRFLETENNRLTLQVRQSEEITTREVTSIKSLFENELSDARRSLDDTAQQVAKLRIDATKYKEEADELRVKLARKERALKDAENRAVAAEAQMSEFEARLHEAEKKVKPLEKENKALLADIARLEGQLAETKRRLEEETLARVECQNKLQTLKEELNFKSQVHEQELNETRTRINTTLEEVDGRIQEDYDAKLTEALQDMRAELDERSSMVKEEITIMYESKMAEVEKQAKRSRDSATYIREELHTTKRRVDELLSEVTKLRAQNEEYSSRIRDLEGQLAREHEQYAVNMRIKEDELQRLRDMLDEQMHEYAALADIKIKLDMELSAYRKLLEGEEARLNLSSSTEATPRRTPSRSVVRGTKRKRTVGVEEEIRQSSSNKGYSVNSSATSVIQVTDVDAEGKFVKLLNTSDKDVHLGGWQIRHVAGDQETSYKFHRNIVIKAQQSVTVWSSDSNQTHSPPSDLVMKGQKWVLADDMKTTLNNNDGEEMAVLEMSKSNVASMSMYRTSYSGDRDGERLTGAERESCSVM